MACYRPIRAYRRVNGYDPSTGKWPLTFKKSEGWLETAIDIPCGKCPGCRMDYARSWAVRCMHEASLYDRNCCVTLTYSSEFLPVDGNVSKRALQLWFKLARHYLGSFRYFACGEYGSTGGRPHYHCLLFGVDFEDKQIITNHGGSRQYDSQLLRSIWKFGHVSVGSCDYRSAAYIARYCFKKQLARAEKGGKTPEFVLMSTRPGIGAGWIDRFASDVVSARGVLHQGHVMKIPKFYETHLDENSLAVIRKDRLQHLHFETDTRLMQRCEHLQQQLKEYRRSFEQ